VNPKWVNESPVFGGSGVSLAISGEGSDGRGGDSKGLDPAVEKALRVAKGILLPTRGSRQDILESEEAAKGNVIVEGHAQ